MRKYSSQLSVWACAMGMGAILAGCQGDPSGPRTPGEKTEVQGKMVQEAGSARQKGEQMMVDGQGKRARGQQLIAQGKNQEGQALVTEGDAQVLDGQKMIQQAEDMKARAFQMPVTTQPGTAR